MYEATEYEATGISYETDFYAWTRQQAALLRAEELETLDLPNLAEEIESMGISQRKEITSRLIVLIMHLLKWQYQPASHDRPQPRSWLNTITIQRQEIELVLRGSPSLRRELPEHIAYAYPRARTRAHQETRIALNTFPIACPYTQEQILDDFFFPF